MGDGHEAITCAGAVPAAAELPLRFDPVFVSMAVPLAAGVPEGMRAVRDFCFVHERQPVTIEVLQPLVPGDRAELAETRKVEADSRRAVLYVDGCGTRRGGLARRRFRMVACRPLADLIVVTRSDGVVPVG